MVFFQFCPYFSIHPSLPKIRYSHPNKKYFSEISKTRANTSQSFSVWSLKVWWLWQAFENGLFFGQIMLNDSENHLNNKWLPWKQNKRYLIYSKFSMSLRSTPNSLQSFQSLRVRILEITGWARPPYLPLV